MKKYKATYLPVFFLIDVSYSMLEEKPGGGTLLDAANQLVPGIVEACEKYSVLDQRLRLGLIEFCDEARVVIPLSEIDAFSENIPQLVAKGGTNFAAAFWAVFNEMGVAVESLRKPEIGIHRPTVFFITDGEDIGDVEERARAWAALSDEGFRYRPNFFTFGVGNANLEGIRAFKLGSGFAAATKDPTRAVQRLQEILNTLVSSIVSSSAGDNPTGKIIVDPKTFNSNEWEVDDEFV